MFLSLRSNARSSWKQRDICDRCDRKWFRRHHESCPNKDRPAGRGTKPPEPITVPPPPTPAPGVKEASVRRRLARKTGKSGPRIGDPDEVIAESKAKGEEKSKVSLSNGPSAASALPEPSAEIPVLTSAEEEKPELEKEKDFSHQCKNSTKDSLMI